jgi:tRNA A37 threonylcarbamoyladenosine dehydratase
MTDTATVRIDSLTGGLGGARCLVVGAGSVGSNLAEMLVRHGVGHISIMDGDVVSVANLSRSNYSAADVGTNKVNALALRLRAIKPDLSVDPIARNVQEIDASSLRSKRMTSSWR